MNPSRSSSIGASIRSTISSRLGISTAASSRTLSCHRQPQADRYLAIHTYFTRQASSLTIQPRVRARSVTLPPHSISSRSRHDYRYRYSSSTTSTGPPSKTPKEQCPNPNCPASASSASTSNPNIPSTPPPPPPPLPHPPSHVQDYIPFIRRLINQSHSLASKAHRPSKEDLLGAANGWWQRLRIRLKWFTIRGWRRFNTDDFSAFASWFVVGNTLWILIGTTTFVSAVFATLNSLSLQEYVARWISDYMTYNTGVTVIFESAIVPRWGASVITFRNVYVSRRPQSASEQEEEETESGSIKLTKDKTPTKTATAKPPSPIPFLSSSISPETYLAAPKAPDSENYTMFDINLDEVEVSLSFMRWLDGKGLVKEAKVKGVRGVIDRRSVWWDSSKPLDPADFRHATRPGDFELESLQVEDFLVTVYQPGGQRPYNVSVFNAAIGPLRKRWLFYDMLSAEAITGQFDNCLFSLHLPQKLGKSVEGEESLVKRMARFRIDGLPIEHAQYASGSTGPMAWITAGKLDAVLDIKFPAHPDDEVDIKALFEEIGRNVTSITQGNHPHDIQPPSSTSAAIDAEAAATLASSTGNGTTQAPRGVIPGAHRLARPPLRAPDADEFTVTGDDEERSRKDERKVTVDIDLRFRDLKAAVPMFTSDLSVKNNALIRPIVAFINANRTLVPIHCSVAADLSDFDGSWTLFETGLMRSVSDQIYAALAHHVSSEAANSKRIRQVGFWGIQKGAEVLLDTLRNVVDPVHGQLLTV